MLDDFGNELDNTESKIDSTMKKMAKVLHMNNGKSFLLRLQLYRLVPYNNYRHFLSTNYLSCVQSHRALRQASVDGHRSVISYFIYCDTFVYNFVILCIVSCFQSQAHKITHNNDD